MNRCDEIDYQIDRACLYLSLLCEFFIGVFVDKYHVKFHSYSTDFYVIEYLGTIISEISINFKQIISKNIKNPNK